MTPREIIVVAGHAIASVAGHAIASVVGHAIASVAGHAIASVAKTNAKTKCSRQNTNMKMWELALRIRIIINMHACNLRVGLHLLSSVIINCLNTIPGITFIVHSAPPI